MVHAGVYSSILHYLKTVNETKGAEDGVKVVEKVVKAKPTDDALFGRGSIRKDGRKIHGMYLFRVKTPDESRDRTTSTSWSAPFRRRAPSIRLIKRMPSGEIKLQDFSAFQENNSHQAIQGRALLVPNTDPRQEQQRFSAVPSPRPMPDKGDLHAAQNICCKGWPRHGKPVRIAPTAFAQDGCQLPDKAGDDRGPVPTWRHLRYHALARLVAQELTKTFRQQFIVDNRAGANSNIGATNVSRANPDGYTLLLSGVGSNAISYTLYRLGYDPESLTHHAVRHWAQRAGCQSEFPARVQGSNWRKLTRTSTITPAPAPDRRTI